MYEDKTFENILGEMLSYVSDKYPDVDTREGSMIYTALAPIALELETAYHEMTMILDETFLETASKEYLVKHGNQLGVELNEATCGHFVGEFDVAVDIGSRFNLDKFNYNVIDVISKPHGGDVYYTYELVCETAGSEPNGYLGDLTPITYVPNLGHAKLISVMIYGEDEEDTESYRYRLQTHAKEPPVNGNVAQYNEWLDEYDGVGKYKVIPCWNGVNTVKLLILNSEDTTASDELIAEVQEYFDPLSSPGMGDGKAPIGAEITVCTLTETPVVINCELVLNEEYTEPTGVQDRVIAYLNSLTLDNTTIEYMPIWAEIYDVASVASITSLSITVNGTTMNSADSPFVTNVKIGDTEIPVLDTENSVWSV